MELAQTTQQLHNLDSAAATAMAMPAATARDDHHTFGEAGADTLGGDSFAANGSMAGGSGLVLT